MDTYNDTMFEEYPDVLTAQEMCSALGICVNSAYKLIGSGQIRHMKIGRKIIIPKRYLIDFVVESCYNDSTVESELTVNDEEGN